MELLPKIALFYAGLWAVLWLLRRAPNSALSQLAFSWHGPFPAVGERRSTFMQRQAAFAFSWLLQILLVAAALVLAVRFYEPLRSSDSFQVVCSFALTIGAGMAFVSAVYCALVSAKARFIGPDPVFELAAPEEAERCEDDA